MASTEADGKGYASLWRAALRDAAGVVAAYITPVDYSLASYAVRGVETGTADLRNEVCARLDLGRAAKVHSLLPALSGEVNTAFRHTLVRSAGYLRGKLHLPRYVQDLARGNSNAVPVIQATRHVDTPENLFVSEVVRLSRELCGMWASRGGAEGKFAANLAADFARFETQAPWAALRSRSRPALGDLSSAVQGRLVSGAIPPGSAISSLAEIFPIHGSFTQAGLEETISELAFMACNDDRFEDRVFELLVVGWLIDAVSTCFVDTSIDLSMLKRSNGRPILTASIGSRVLELYFQTGVDVLPVGVWRYTHSMRPLRAIPDVVLRLYEKESGISRVVLVDAKNRGTSSESDVAYKLLGYKENLRLSPYTAFGVYPGLGPELRMRRIESAHDRIVLVRAPLLRGRTLCRRMVKHLAGD